MILVISSLHRLHCDKAEIKGLMLTILEGLLMGNDAAALVSVFDEIDLIVSRVSMRYQN